ncbi:hypothetical protein [Streptacidiphilus neutrinimicus]|uniref:hypothetical protein n=1 Tax=Streptacidiphilus neutrinimicus TaxID=105420 RepID=UPI0005AA3932|nr:hypothetical protein [Streptacidiphilus neutrinimicus]
MTRDELDALAAALRGHGTLPRSVDQALQAVEAYLTLAEAGPDAPALRYERGRALDLWQALQDTAAALALRAEPPRLAA